MSWAVIFLFSFFISSFLFRLNFTLSIHLILHTIFFASFVWVYDLCDVIHRTWLFFLHMAPKRKHKQNIRSSCVLGTETIFLLILVNQRLIWHIRWKNSHVYQACNRFLCYRNRKIHSMLLSFRVNPVSISFGFATKYASNRMRMAL